jgi:hypothetical protein
MVTKLALNTAYIIIGAIAWTAARWAYTYPFQWAEYVPGINLVYLPHGMSMVLVVLFGLSGGIGISIATALTGWAVIQANPELGWLQTLVAGSAAVVTRYIILGPFRSLEILLTRLNGRALLTLALASSVISSAGHVLAWYWFDSEATDLAMRFFNMSVGNFFGALIFLYVLKYVNSLIKGFLSHGN